VQIAADAVAHVVKRGGQRLADACAVIAVAASVRHARDDGGAQQALAVDDFVVTVRPDGAQAGHDLGECRRRIERPAPAPPRHRHDVGDRRVQSHQRSKGLFHQPDETRLRQRSARLGHRRHMMDHIAKRRCLDEQDVGHALLANHIPIIKHGRHNHDPTPSR
jgi:hypothetical protein